MSSSRIEKVKMKKSTYSNSSNSHSNSNASLSTSNKTASQSMASNKSETSRKVEKNKISSKMAADKKAKSNTSLSTSNKSASQSMDCDNSTEIPLKAETNKSSSNLAANKKTTSNTSLSTSNKSASQSMDFDKSPEIPRKAETNKSSSNLAANKKTTSNTSLSTSNKSASQSMDSDNSTEIPCKTETNKSSSNLAVNKKTTSNTFLSTSNKSASQSMDFDKSPEILRKAETNKSSSTLAANKKATRVIQSRYKSSAVASKKDTSTGILDKTLSTTIVAPRGQKLQSSSNRSGTAKESAGGNGPKQSSLQRSGSIKKEPIGSSGLLKPSLQRSASIKKQLHSTAINATYLDASSLEQTVISDPCKFSTTVVSDKAGILSSQPEAFGELPDLVDISIIAKPSKEQSVELQEPAVTTAVTADDLEQAHLHALLWQLLDVESNHAAAMQEKEAMNQLIYLDQLVKQKEMEVHESSEKLTLLEEAERAHAAYKTQMEELKSLSDYIPAIGDATENLSRGLEKTLHQINTKDIYTPQDDVQYGANFEVALDENLKLLEDLENKMHPRQESILCFQNHVNDTQMVSNMMQECSIKIQQSESLAVQEASLKLGDTQKGIERDTQKGIESSS